MMKSLGDLPQVKIPSKEIVPCRRHIAAPSEGRLPLGERKGHGTLPGWGASFSSCLARRVDSRNGNPLTQPISRAAIGSIRSALRFMSELDLRLDISPQSLGYGAQDDRTRLSAFRRRHPRI